MGEAVPDTRSALRFLRWLVAYHRWSILLGAVFASAWTVSQALVPAALGKAIDAGIVARDQGALLLWGAVVLALGIFHAVTATLQDRTTLTSKIGAAYQTMRFVTRHACRLGATLPKRISTGAVVSVGVSDITQIGAAMEMATRGIGALAAIIVIGALMLTASWQLGLVVLAGVPLMVWLTTRLIRPLLARSDKLREQQGTLTDRAVDIVVGLRVLRGIGGEEVFARRYRAESQRVRQAGVQLARVDTLIDAAKVLLPGILIVVIVWLGAERVLAGQLSVGELVAFYGYGAFLVVPLRRITFAIAQGMKAYVAAQRVTRLLNLRPELADGPLPMPGPGALADPGSGLVVPPGRFTAVACASPADAALLADRLGRYADSDARYAGIPLADLPLDEIRRRILVVRNDAALFSGPLRAELDPADRAALGYRALVDAIHTASAVDLVEALPDGLDGRIVGAGRELSGGQQQRLRLVRALMADPEVLVLVDPTSAVDAHTEARIATRLRAGRTGRATLVFTTSPILLNQADQVSFVEDGRVVAEGTHPTLLDDPRYRAVVARQAP